MKYLSLFRKKSLDHILADKEAGKQHVHEVLSLRDLTMFGIAAIVGAGIFSTIGQAVVHGGPAVSLLFVFTAFSCGLSALCYAKFASVIPVSGSAYTYTYFSLGELAAWMVGWSLILEYAVSNIAVAISWSSYFSTFIEGFGVKIPSTFLIAGNTISINFPAFIITLLVTAVCYVGIKESRNSSNILVFLKLIVIALVLLVGVFYVKPENWVPFAPNGISGVLFGISSVFFAFIGFDAISTMSEECKNPQRDMPKAMIWSLGISTLIYVAITLVLTGMVNYKLLGVGDPLAFVFENIGLNFLSGFISLISVITLSSVLLVYQLGQPRIWMTMSRDGLLPKIFAKVHPKFKTPSFSTIVMGIVVATPAMFVDIKDVIDLTSMGTLFAFMLVCGGVSWQEVTKENLNGKFQIPYVDSRNVLPVIILIGSYFTVLNGFSELNFLRILFMFVAIMLSSYAIYKRLSVLPVIGFLSNLWLMTELGDANWFRFFVWFVFGLLVYIFYGYHKSKLKANKA